MTRNSFGSIGSCRRSSTSDADDDPRLEEVADIMAGLAEQAYTSGEINLGEVAHDDLPFDLLDALAVESDPRAQRLLDLMRERGWASWTRTRPERLAKPPDLTGDQLCW